MAESDVVSNVTLISSGVEGTLEGVLGLLELLFFVHDASLSLDTFDGVRLHLGN